MNISQFPHPCFLDDVDDIGLIVLIVSSVWSQGQYRKIVIHCLLRSVCRQKINVNVDEYEGQALAKCVRLTSDYETPAGVDIFTA